MLKEYLHEIYDPTIYLKLCFFQLQKMVILFVDDKVVRIYYICSEVLSTMEKGIMYHLTDGHVDGVGLLQNEALEYWVVYVQVSVQQYKKHSPNLESLFRTKKA